MNSYKKMNNILGWSVGILASIVYLMTMEASVSLWDCGEFISCAYKLEVSHSPGAPFFSILARLFILLFGDNPKTVHSAVNSLSAISSGMTVMFLFWTITHLARKMFGTIEKNTKAGEIMILGSGLLGSLAFAFSDTFWFSAVEGEVYALSSLIMALVFWAMLKWESMADQPHADRWILLIALIMGISIGVHLLNLLTIPALVLIYYFRKTKQVTLTGGLSAFVIGALLLGIVQYIIILDIPKWSFGTDIAFVNDLGMPFYSGIIFFFVALILALYFGYKYARKNGWYYLQLGVWATCLLLIGYSTYITIVIRSSVNPAIDMGSPDTAPRLNSFLSREQYGDVPLLSGPYYSSFNKEGIESIEQLGPNYYQGATEYDFIEYKRKYKFRPEVIKFFPRIWDGNDPRHVQFYQQFLDLSEGETPTVGGNFRFFFQHQFWNMYMRYFLWNWVGRANDTQGRFFGEPRKSPYASGIKFIDQGRVGDLDILPDVYSKNKARNKLYYFPLIFGLIGLIIQYMRNQKDFWTVLTLFFFTGIAIMIFVNNVPDQPRERDYSYVGSTYAFAIWIGLGVWGLAYLLHKHLIKNSRQSAALIASVLGIILVPGIMLSQEWDDHDRSKKTIGEDTGYNYLVACAPNAILFTEGDNDTYPLWYAQEVLGIRRDVRIINLSLLGIDWYVDQLNRKINDAPAVKMMWKPNDYVSSKRDVCYYNENIFPKDSFMDLRDAIAFNLDESKGMPERDGPSKVYFWPSKNLKLSVDKSSVIKNKVLPESMIPNMVDEIRWDLGKDQLLKNDMTVLNIIAANMFERPIYFSTTIQPDNYQGLEKYMLLEGIVVRFAPIFTPEATQNEPGIVNIDKTYNLLMDSFRFGGSDNPKVYFDEPNRRSLTNFRAAYAKLSKALSLSGDSVRAVKCLDFVMNKIKLECLPYDLSTLFITEAYYRAGAKEKASSIAKNMSNDSRKVAKYYKSLPSDYKKSFLFGDLQFDMSVVNQFRVWAEFYGDSATARELGTIINEMAMMAPEVFPPQPQQAQQGQQGQPAM